MTERLYIGEGGPGYRASVTTCRGPTEAPWISKVSAGPQGKLGGSPRGKGQGPVERSVKV
jgi:hypothetical protein